VRRVLWSRRAKKDLARLDTALAERILATVDGFAASGRGDIKHLQGQLAGESRLRVGDQRVVFDFDANEIRVLRIVHRGEAYR